MLERVVVRPLIEYLRQKNLLPESQAGFLPGHSMETAVLQELSDILTSVDHGDFAALHWFCWTCLQLMILSTIAFFFSSFIVHWHYR